MTNDWETKGVERVAKQLSDDATFLSGWLPKEPDGREILEGHLTLQPADWNKLLLCRPPMPDNFWDDVQTIAEYVGAEPNELAQGLREAAVLGALKQTLGEPASIDLELADLEVAAMRMPERTFAAARDHLAVAAEPMPVETSPRVRIKELADQFWRDAGQANVPHDLQRAVSVALPVAVTFLPNLRFNTVSSWLQSFAIRYDPSERDRALKGLLIATRGLGMVFVDGSLDEPDRRFTLAHEVGHFLVDYLEHRRRILKEMPELLPVIDGDRDASNAERARAALQRIPIGTYMKAIERDPQGGASFDIEQMEDEATLFAMELLAPWDEAVELVGRLTQNIDSFEERLGVASNALATEFELPTDVARARARAVLENVGGGRGFFDR